MKGVRCEKGPGLFQGEEGTHRPSTDSERVPVRTGLPGDDTQTGLYIVRV